MVVRIQTAMTLYVFAALGVFLLAVPWTSIWDEAALSLLPAWLGAWVRSGWVRGAVSGLGALDLVVASQEAGRLWRALRASQRQGARP